MELEAHAREARAAVVGGQAFIWPASAGTKKEFITVDDVILNWMGRSTGAAISLTVAMPCSGYRNSHFQSSATTSTTSGLVPAGTSRPSDKRASGR
ncbi:hypothetical protein G6F68_019272 [Rhizopus microsporus]|nr:hypothetical protein G6F68_019272 [Rhizopus microsporus]